MAFTEKQKMALDVKDRTLLISAGAGSGKTTTLIERIIRTLTDPEDPADITELLIVTFTNAAVEEIRVRVEKALNAAVRAEPQNHHLQKQLQLLSAANIMTIDGLCQEFLKRNAESLGLLPNYRIADTAEGALLASDVMENVLSGFYDGAYADRVSEKDFLELTELLVGYKGTEKGIGTVLLDLYDKTVNHEKGVFVLSDVNAQYPEADAPEKTPFGAYALEQIREPLRELKRAYESCLSLLRSQPGQCDKWEKCLSEDYGLLTALSDCQTYGQIRQTVEDFHFEKAPAVSKAKGTDVEFLCQGLHGVFKGDYVDGTVKPFVVCSVSDYMEVYGKTRKAAVAVAAVLCTFDECFRAEKKRLGICEYADLERYFYESLWKDGKRTPTAEMMREQYRMIFVDEYQDINPLQHKIFEALSKDDNRFMVGDIKQSIYGFRSADPTIFAEMKNTFRDCDPKTESTPSKIFMSDNFRCDAGVVLAVNEIFDVLFGAIAERMGYVEDERMIYHKDNGVPQKKPEAYLIEKKQSHQKGGDDEDEAERESMNSAAAEATVMAKKIFSLQKEKKNDGTPISYGDIVVLLRKSGNMQTMIDVFEKYGIPCRGPGETQFFKSSSVLLAIALLNAIDNPYRDIYLCGAMMSPLFGFTPDEMAAIRKTGTDAPLYVSLLRHLETHPDFSKARQFLDTLSRYRKLSEGSKPQDVLFRLYHETGLLSLAVRNGEDDNLWLLYENARRFENSSYQGLGSFLRYLSRILERNGTFDAPDSTVPAENAVRFMTIHASKGLEFPVVFVAECGASLTDRDAQKPILFSERLGFAAILNDETGTVRVDTPMRYAIKHISKRRMLDEDMRVFYVALTRASERLFLFGCTSKSPEELENKRLNAADENLRKFSVLSSASFLGWLILSAKESVSFHYIGEGATAQDVPEEETETQKPEEVRQDPADPALVAVLKERFSYEYPDSATLGIPEKLSVSKLYPNVLDGTDEDLVASLDDAPEEPKHREPGFLTGKIEDEAAKRGIATHAFLQFCDFEHLETAGAEAERQRLLEKRFLSEQDAALVRMEEIESFRHSALAARMRNAKTLHRELRFHVRLPAEEFTLDEEKKRRLAGKKMLVQGVMDCVMEEADGTLTLIDYKTDRLPYYAIDDPEIGAKILREKHQRQLSYYREAVLSIFGKYPDKTEIYSLLLGRTVSL